MAPWPLVPAHAAKMKMHSLPYMEELSWSVRPAPYELATAMKGTKQKATATKYHCAQQQKEFRTPQAEAGDISVQTGQNQEATAVVFRSKQRAQGKNKHMGFVDKQKLS